MKYPRSTTVQCIYADSHILDCFLCICLTVCLLFYRLLFVVTHCGPQLHKLRVILVIELIQHSHVLAVAQQPVDGGKVLPLGQLLVQTPEHLVEREGGSEGEGMDGGRDEMNEVRAYTP